jgi:alkylation response protein AidB-like acyl-CoA dehydrogenase
MRFCFVPKEEIAVLDTWITGGMRGTGSTEWEASNVFVPEAQTGQIFTGVASHPDPIFKLPVSSFGHLTCAVAIGIARGAIEGLKTLAKQGKPDLRDQGYAQYGVAKAEALCESGHLYAQEAFRAVWQNVLAGRREDLDQRMRVRRAYVHAVESSIEAVALCSDAAGGAAVFETWPFARALRDVNAIRGHAVLSRRFMELAGRAAFDLPVPHPLF